MGHIYLYHGTGGGKTTSALGIALRSVGHGKKTVIIQFLKCDTNTGEYKIMERLKPYYEIYQFGRPGWIGTGEEEIRAGGMSFKVRKADEKDRDMGRKGIEFAANVLKKKPYLVVLDEICLAIHLRIIRVDEVLRLLSNVPQETDIILTGRFAPKELLDRADFVNEIIERKAPENFVTKKGIQF